MNSTEKTDSSKEADSAQSVTQADHGGDWTGTLLDFSISVSPLGIPPHVRGALRQAGKLLTRYPDPLCRRLCAALGERETVPPEWILCGNGASDLIYRAALARRPRRAVITAPAFSEYETALALSGCQEIVRYPLREEAAFRMDGGFLDTLTPQTDLIFLCQPNNPTGVTIPQPLLRRILERCREIGCLFVLDECFLGFLESPYDFTLQDDLSAYGNLLIIRAFTKLFALAGVRLGYALCSDAAFLEQMRRSGPPWSVSCLAEAAGLSILEEGHYKGMASMRGSLANDYANAARLTVAHDRPILYAELQNLGLRVIPGEANFLLFQSPKPLDEPLRRQGILLRNCGNFHGLDQTWYRTAIRFTSQNRRLIAAIKEALS